MERKHQGARTKSNIMMGCLHEATQGRIDGLIAYQGRLQHLRGFLPMVDLMNFPASFLIQTYLPVMILLPQKVGEGKNHGEQRW